MSLRPLAPVAIFAFNRPDKLRKLIDSLHSCELSDRTHFIFFVDGPRHDRDAPLVSEVINIVRDCGLASFEMRSSTQNQGLRQSVYAGVSELVERYGRAIALEDDLVLSPIALRFFNEGLDRYEDDHSIWSICGYIWDVPQFDGYPRALVLPMTHSWGWATWKRAWDKFDLSARPSDANLASPTFRALFDVNGLYTFTQMMRTSIAGLVSSWYTHWNYVVFQHGGRSIFPPRRVLDNVGIGAGTHGGALNPYRFLVKESPKLLTRMPQLPDPQETDFWAVDLLRKCREMRAQHAVMFAGTIKREIKAKLRLKA